MRKLLLGLASVAVLGSVVAVSTPPATAGDNAAIAINLKDGSSDFRLAFKITRVNTDVVDTGNAAVAVASCSNCQTVAVAIQAVLIFDDASVITPTNFAFAYNLECDHCYTLATAYQFVATTGVVRFTADGNEQIAEIRRELEALRNSDLTIEEIQARVDSLANELLVVMKTELVGAGSAGTAAATAAATATATDSTVDSTTATTATGSTTADPTTTESTTTDSATAGSTTTDSTTTDSTTDSVATDPAPTTTDSSTGTTTTSDPSGGTTTGSSVTTP